MTHFIFITINNVIIYVINIKYRRNIRFTGHFLNFILSFIIADEENVYNFRSF
jgi:hypothetical protein